MHSASRRKNKLFALLFTFLGPLVAMAQQDNPDSMVLEKIKGESLQNSKVMDIAFHLTDMNGSRLTNSPGFIRSANYAKAQLEKWGLSNVAFDSYGEYGQGWELERSYVALKFPFYKPIAALPRAWSMGTNGLRIADLLLIEATDISALARYKGKLAGKILLLDSDMGLPPVIEADKDRLTDADLKQLEAEKPFMKGVMPVTAKKAMLNTQVMRRSSATVQAMLKDMGLKERALAIINCNINARDEMLIVGGINGFRKDDPPSITDIMFPTEDYRTLLRLLRANVQVKLELNIGVKFLTSDLQGYNVIAEIVGSDAELKNEVVMLGAHLDSWHGSVGATDNAAGVAVIMEAIRILKALNLRLKRTIRIALWGGEEQGMLGSRGYVRKHFISPDTLTFLPAYEKFNGYFNLDNGSGVIRGIYLSGNEAARAIFAKWLLPLSEMGVKTLSQSRNGGISDHLAFLEVGLPAFQFIQDPLDYNTRTHHTTQDTYSHLKADDLQKSAMIVASLLYNSANQNERLPRK